MQPGGGKVTITQKSGLPANVVQVIQTRPGSSTFQQRTPQFNTVPVQPQSIQMNTNTALQYVRKPQEMTLVTPSGTFMASNMTPQPYGQVVSIGQANVSGVPGLTQALVGSTGITPQSTQAAQQNTNSLTNARKPCNCTKSHCLKLYCECFAQGQLCQNCNCNHCMNNLAYEEERGRAIKMTLERNPTAFHPKIGRGEGERKHTKGCNCKRSGCLKNYCECYEAKISCSDLCRCIGCRNTEDSIERRSLMRLAAMGSLRSRQPNAFRKHLVKVPAETMPHVFFTWETIEAAASCLLAAAEDAERRDLPPATQERIILEEFARTLDRVVDATAKARVHTSSSIIPSSSALTDEMGMVSSRGVLGAGTSHHYRQRTRHDGDDLVEDEDDDFQDVGDGGRGSYGVGDSSGPFGGDDDLDLLDRHSQQFGQRRRTSMPIGAGSSRDTGGGEPSRSGSKVPGVKFISRSGNNGRTSSSSSSYMTKREHM